MSTSVIVIMATLGLAIRIAGAQATSPNLNPSAGTIDGVIKDTSLVPSADATVSILGSDRKPVTTASRGFRDDDRVRGAEEVRRTENRRSR